MTAADACRDAAGGQKGEGNTLKKSGAIALLPKTNCRFVLFFRFAGMRLFIQN
jgi:hypothetical protein